MSEKTNRFRKETSGSLQKGADQNAEIDFGDVERCVVCGRLTGVRRDTPVSGRKTYLRGAGQLCEDCCFELYHTTDLRTLSEL